MNNDKTGFPSGIRVKRKRADRVKVKPLVWETGCAMVFRDGSGQAHCAANGYFRMSYKIYESPSEGISVAGTNGFGARADTLDAAKAAAQADYEARILAALDLKGEGE